MLQRETLRERAVARAEVDVNRRIRACGFEQLSAVDDAVLLAVNDEHGGEVKLGAASAQRAERRLMAMR
ncbi:MAG: hypothetical protein JNK82_26955 [Myxococcaceae bacterium]|nr:hypothetical protein [Myxococcaceae bacterium]